MDIDINFINSINFYNITKKIFDKYFDNTETALEQKIYDNINILNKKYKDFFELEENKKILSLLELSSIGISFYNKIKNNNTYNEIDKPYTLLTSLYIDELFNSYKNFDDIVRQMTCDFPREKIYLNNVNYTNISIFINEIMKYNRDIKNNLNVLSLSISLICQSSFFNSYSYLVNNLFSQISNNKILSNYNVADDNKHKYIYFTINENEFKCVLVVFYKIIDIDTEHIIYRIKSETIFDIDNENCVFVYEKI